MNPLSLAGTGLILKRSIVAFRTNYDCDDWRGDNSSDVRYLFFCILYFPIIPLKCYRVKAISGEVIASEKWRFSEVFLIYFQTAVILLPVVWIACQVP